MGCKIDGPFLVTLQRVTLLVTSRVRQSDRTECAFHRSGPTWSISWPLRGQHGRVAGELRLPRLRALGVHVLPLRAEGVLVALPLRERRRLWATLLPDRSHPECWCPPCPPCPPASSGDTLCLADALQVYTTAFPLSPLRNKLCANPSGYVCLCIASKSTSRDQQYAYTLPETCSPSCNSRRALWRVTKGVCRAMPG